MYHLLIIHSFAVSSLDCVNSFNLNEWTNEQLYLLHFLKTVIVENGLNMSFNCVLSWSSIWFVNQTSIIMHTRKEKLVLLLLAIRNYTKWLTEPLLNKCSFFLLIRRWIIYFKHKIQINSLFIDVVTNFNTRLFCSIFYCRCNWEWSFCSSGISAVNTNNNPSNQRNEW